MTTKQLEAMTAKLQAATLELQASARAMRQFVAQQTETIGVMEELVRALGGGGRAAPTLRRQRLRVVRGGKDA
jgi:hypothetical protein